ncbi:hypothetical protein K469DRAFT_612314 [Zopfia rhizophila CBS 207.26]|uniref:Uncharacterized protein n=1 Tax=Zopfia rhizophila CBS 207.26 TaxID=1314779 RepID=A0A6A6D6C4_9PEZI|nr:hypothetical protein K469DRAFT_612314 [Zopfia rhizophila CBS 207.26]
MRSIRFLPIVFWLPLHVAALCYFPDRKTVPNQDTPCSTEGNSTCCGQGFACMSNNICKLTKYVKNPGPAQDYLRGSCTDPTWKDPNCPSFCASAVDGDKMDGGMGLRKCEGSDLDAYFCLNTETEGMSNSEVCSNSDLFITFQGEKPQ